MNPLSIRELFEYNYWAFDLIWQSISQLNDEQFTTDLNYSFGSIRNQVIHLISSHRRWLDRLQMSELTPHLIFDDFLSLSSTRTEWDNARLEMLEYVYSLDQADLDEPIHYQIKSRSIDAAHRRWEILIHLVNHSTDHRSQMLATLNRQFGIDTPEQDFIIFLWSQNQNK
jgi:uncharacterized damage-inducible protein DinB